MQALLNRLLFATVVFFSVVGEKSALSDDRRPSDPLVRIVRTAMLVEALVPDVSVEFVPGQPGIGTTLALPLIARLGVMDMGEMTARKHVFALAVVEPQLALGRKLDHRFRGLASVRLGAGLYRQNLSFYLESGYHLSQRSEESGALVGLGIGYLPQHMASLGIVLRRYMGEESRVAVGVDFSMPLHLWVESW